MNHLHNPHCGTCRDLAEALEIRREEVEYLEAEMRRLKLQLATLQQEWHRDQSAFWELAGDVWVSLPPVAASITVAHTQP